MNRLNELKKKYTSSLKNFKTFPLSTLEEVSRHDWNSQSDPTNDHEGLNLLAVVKIVSAAGDAPDKATRKTLILIDPTGLKGTEVVLRKGVESSKDIFLPIVEIGDIFLLKGVKRGMVVEKYDVRDTLVCENLIDGIESWTCFTKDWSNEDQGKMSNTSHQNDEERKINSVTLSDLQRILEEWWSRILLTQSLFKLTESKVLNPNLKRWYVDLVVHPLRKRIMEKSVVVSFWDGSLPSLTMIDSFDPEYKAFHPDEEWNSQELKNPLIIRLSKGFRGHINTWMIEETLYGPHFGALEKFDLDSGDYLIFFNVEVNAFEIVDDEKPEHESDDSTDGASPSFSIDKSKALVQLKRKPDLVLKLDLRSGSYQGKSVRIVKKKSLLGRMFSQLIMLRTEWTIKQMFKTGLISLECVTSSSSYFYRQLYLRMVHWVRLSLEGKEKELDDDVKFDPDLPDHKISSLPECNEELIAPMMEKHLAELINEIKGEIFTV